MDIDWIMLAAGYVLFLILSRGALSGAGKAMSEWGGASAANPTRDRVANLSALGVWRSLVARSVRVGEVPSSNLGTPIDTGEPMVPP